MCSWRRIFVLALAVVALILPAVSYAQGPPPYFISDTKISTSTNTPTGSSTDPFIAADPFSAHNICLQIAHDMSGDKATLYYVRVSPKEYYEFQVQKGTGDAIGECIPQGTLKRGVYPPGFGVALTPAVIVGGLTLVGIVLLGAAWLLYRRSRSGTRAA